jgi:maleylpyruvate isomerase
MKLYGYWRSTAAYRVRIALNLKQLEVEHHSVHLVKDGGEQHQAAYRALNPQGLVPILIDQRDDGEKVISQSLAIINYLDNKHPKPALLPADAYLASMAQSIAQSICSDIHPLNNLRVLQYLTNELEVSDEQKNAWYQHWIAQGFSALERQLEVLTEQGQRSTGFCIGDKPSLADICLVPQVYNAQRYNCPMDEYPLINEINTHCLSISAFEQAIPEKQADAS